MLNALHRSRSKRQGRHKDSGGRNLTAQLSCMQASPWPCLAPPFNFTHNTARSALPVELPAEPLRAHTSLTYSKLCCVRIFTAATNMSSLTNPPMRVSLCVNLVPSRQQCNALPTTMCLI